MASGAISEAYADYSFLYKQCSSIGYCCSPVVGFCATRSTNLGGADHNRLSSRRRKGDDGGTEFEARGCRSILASAHRSDRHHRWHARVRARLDGRDGAGTAERCRRGDAGGGAAAVQADGADNAPTDVARPMPAETAGSPCRCRRCPSRSMGQCPNRFRLTGPRPPVGRGADRPRRGGHAARREELGEHAHRHHRHPQRRAELVQHR